MTQEKKNGKKKNQTKGERKEREKEKKKFPHIFSLKYHKIFTFFSFNKLIHKF